MSHDIKLTLANIKDQIAHKDYLTAYRGLKRVASPDYPFAIQQRMGRMMGSIPPNAINLRPLKLALLASCTLDHFVDGLRFWASLRGIALTVWVAPFDTTEQTVLDPISELYEFKPDIVWIFDTYRDIDFSVPSGADAEAVDLAIDQSLQRAANLWQTLRDNLGCQILHNMADIPAHGIFGNYESNARWSLRSLLRSYNCGLTALVAPGVTIFDLDHVASLFGKRNWTDQKYWFYSKHHFTFDAIGLVAHLGASVLAALCGLSKKCVVVDLDNTLWGGVIGDDGLEGIRLGVGPEGEAFIELQKHLKSLKERGIILAVSSKNNDDVARSAFERHPDMHLSLVDIAVFRANWENKADNVKYIAEVLNIGLDSIVFVDDNPAEQEIVRSFLPEVEVPELSDDPTTYVDTLAFNFYFETSTFQAEDRNRAVYYRDNAQRTEFSRSFVDTAGYLRSLQMVAEVGYFDELRVGRIAQLINKSNQFHLTGTRYTEAQIRSMMADNRFIGLWFSLRDRFGDNGLVSAVIMEIDETEKSAHIDTWVMSCRVLARGMEEFICNTIVECAATRNCETVSGTYVPSKKNTLVKDLYSRLKFTPLHDESKSRWRASTANWEGLPTAIKMA